jgi:hypothetical protein
MRIKLMARDEQFRIDSRECLSLPATQKQSGSYNTTRRLSEFVRLVCETGL